MPKDLALLTRSYERFIIVEDKKLGTWSARTTAKVSNSFPNLLLVLTRLTCLMIEKCNDETKKLEKSGEPYEVLEKKLVYADDDLYVFCTQWICCNRPANSSFTAIIDTKFKVCGADSSVILFGTGGRRDRRTWKMITFANDGNSKSQSKCSQCWPPQVDSCQPLRHADDDLPSFYCVTSVPSSASVGSPSMEATFKPRLRLSRLFAYCTPVVIATIWHCSLLKSAE